MDSRRLKIFIHDPFFAESGGGESAVREVEVCDKDLVAILDNFIPEGGQRFIIHEGKFIMSSFSFGFYKIADGSHLFVVRTNPFQYQISYPKIVLNHKMRKNSSTEQRFNLSQGFHPNSNTDLVLETTRLRDQFLTKIDSNYMLHRSVMAKLAKREAAITDSAIKGGAVVSNQKPLIPSSEELPIFWSTDSEMQPVPR